MRRLLATLAALALAGCFNIDEPACSFICSDDQMCPQDYECRSDGYCHKLGNNTACLFPDAALAPIDQGIPADMSMPDMAAPDLAPEVDLSADDASNTD